MGTYRTPTDAPVSSDWNDHDSRDPRSPEPGTDYACAYGTDLRIPGNGVVSVIDTSPGGGEGRRMSIDLDDGRRLSFIHLSRISAWIGQRVSRDQTGVAISGASGYGSDWYYGPHVHTSLWERPGMSYSATIDFERYIGGTVPPPDQTEETMSLFIAIRGGAWNLIVDQGSAKPAAVVLGGDSQKYASGGNELVPRFAFDDNNSWNALKRAVSGL